MTQGENHEHYSGREQSRIPCRFHTRRWRSYCKGERVKPWPDWMLWLMFVLCLVAGFWIALI